MRQQGLQQHWQQQLGVLLLQLMKGQALAIQELRCHGNPQKHNQQKQGKQQQ
jgi:hypothetical protein